MLCALEPIGVSYYTNFTSIAFEMNKDDRPEKEQGSDHSKQNSAESSSLTQLSGGRQNRFLLDLNRMLNEVEDHPDLRDFVGWQSDGKGFMIHNKKQFEKQVMPT